MQPRHETTTMPLQVLQLNRAQITTRAQLRQVLVATFPVTGLTGHVDNYRVCLPLGPHQNILDPARKKTLDTVYLLLIYR